MHGSLENEIMNTIWSLEENNVKNISVSDVCDLMNETDTKRAYTTIKTVMDRLAEKKMLKRLKQGKKFCYKSLNSRNEMAKKAIKSIACQYFSNDVNSLIRTIEKEFTGKI